MFGPAYQGSAQAHIHTRTEDGGRQLEHDCPQESLHTLRPVLRLYWNCENYALHLQGPAQRFGKKTQVANRFLFFEKKKNLDQHKGRLIN